MTDILISKSTDIIKNHCSLLESELSVSPKWEVLPQVKKDHLYLGREHLLMGVFSSDEELITLYPVNIWTKVCGLIPEPFCWDVFEEKVVEVFAHEMRHMWQHKNGTYYQDNAEFDANDYAIDFLSRKEAS